MPIHHYAETLEYSDMLKPRYAQTLEYAVAPKSCTITLKRRYAQTLYYASTPTCCFYLDKAISPNSVSAPIRAYAETSLYSTGVVV